MMVGEHWIILLGTLVPLLVIICIVDGVQNSKQRKLNAEMKEALDVSQKAILKLHQRIDQLQSDTGKDIKRLDSEVLHFATKIDVVKHNVHEINKRTKGVRYHDTQK